MRTRKRQMLPDLRLDCFAQVDVLAQEVLCSLSALAEPFLSVGVPGPGLLNDALLHTKVEQAPLFGDALAVHDVELSLPERRRDLVLDDLGAYTVADELGPLLDRVDPADVDAHRRVEFERAAAGGRL